MFKLSYGWAIILMLFAVSFAGCDDDDDATPPGTITEVASGDDRFTILTAALQRTGLDDVLDMANGTFTVFAPTDAAFTASGIDLTTLSDDALRNVLRYHVLGGVVNAADLGEGDNFANTLGQYGPNDSSLSLLVNKTGTTVTVNGDATVVVADIATANGVIHAVNQVLSPQTIVDFAVKAQGTSELEAALGAASLVPALSGTDPLTVFAPVNSGFEAIAATVAGLTGDQLPRVLTYHVVSGNVRSSALAVGMVPTLNTTNMIDVRAGTDGGFFIQNGTERTDFVITDIQGTNGVIHLINQVLIPSDL